jgi:FG-GAP-like repeat
MHQKEPPYSTIRFLPSIIPGENGNDRVHPLFSRSALGLRLGIFVAVALTLATGLPAQDFGGEQIITTAADGARSVYSTDLDGDGDADVLSASQVDDKIAWYENQGGGTFGPQQIITIAAGGAISVFSTDLDGDGDADVLSASAIDSRIAWYENLGGGTFGQQQIITTAVYGPYSVYAKDLDGDGDADVLSASVNDNKVAWYENLGGGSFGQQQIITTAADRAISVYATDLDGDGDADVLSASSGDDKIAWYENLGGGSFGQQQIITIAAISPWSVYAIDLDGDGDADVLSASRSDNKIAWYENQGGGAFGQQQVITTAAYDAWSVYATDLDGDGDGDVLSASPGDDKIAWYKNLGGGSFGPQRIITMAAISPRSVFAIDLDGDGNADVLSASFNEDKIAWYENLNSQRGFRLVREHSTGSPTYGHGTRLGDLDGDGLSEYGITDRSLALTDVFDGASGQLLRTYTTGGISLGIAGAPHSDITGDGIPEYAFGEPENPGSSVNEGRVFVYSGADGALVRTISGPSSTAVDQQFGSRVAEFVDLNGDGKNELLVSALRGGTSGIYAGSVTCVDGATGSFLYTVEGVGQYNQAAMIADPGPDLDGDGIPEFAIGAREAFSSGDGYLRVHSGATGQALLTINGFGGINDNFGNGHCWTDDQDGDGFEDLIVGAPNSDTYGVDRGQIGVFSSATGALIREIVPPAEVLNVFGAAWRSRLIRIPDTDGDGKEEVLLAAREAYINGIVEGVVYVCSPTTGAVLDQLVCPTRPMPGFGIQSEVLDYTPEGWPRLLLGGSDLSGTGPGIGFIYVYVGIGDLDLDDDGLLDSEEVTIHGTNPSLFDTDGDGLGDGMELGVSVGTPDTDLAVFIPDADPNTTTNPLLADTDGGGVPEGIEDQNRDGRWDTWETDPSNPSDDSPAFYVSNLVPGEIVRFNAYGADPLQTLIPAYSLRGPGPTALGIGVSVDLSTPIRVLTSTISDGNGEASWNGPRVPAGIALGVPIWMQLVEVPFSGALPRVSNAILLPVGAN